MNKIAFIGCGAAALLGGTLFAQSALNLTPSRVVGQPSVISRSSSPNVVEGREFWSPWSVAVDTSSTGGPLYVSDTLNNRILGWANASSFSNGSLADLVIGQLDLQSTVAQGGTTGRSTGLTLPGALAVDRTGNLYVVDTGNNRILRFPRPFASTDNPRTPDMVIGQSSFSGENANAGGISATSIQTSSGSSSGRTGLAFDPQGNLWFSDPLNHRVLRYPVAALTAGTNGPAADVVLGQTSFSTGTAPTNNAESRANRGVLLSPSGLTVDSDGRVYVADSLLRVLVFTPPFFTGKEAARVAGLFVTEPGLPFANQYSILQAEGLFIAGNRLGVVDTGQNRILIFDPFAQWPAPTDTQPSPPARIVLGQADFDSSRVNRGGAEASASSLAAPLSAAFTGSELIVADSGNHRVLAFGQLVTGAAATRVLGQSDFNLSSANRVEGRELFLFAQGAELTTGGGIAIDASSNPPRMYIADTFNNRVLGYADARRVRPGDPADLVIGQSDLVRTLVNAPQNSTSPTETGLFRPSGVAVDANGDLFVTDSGNARVLRFPSPYAQNRVQGQLLRPNLVLGQASFTTRLTDPSARNMGYPYGVALTVEGHLVISDAGHNRMLFFRRPSGGDFTNGMAAEKVIGQPDFFTITRGTAQSSTPNTPAHVTIDSDNRLFVADSGNNRVLVYDFIVAAQNNPPVAFVLSSGLNGPTGIFASRATGEIWVANTRGNQALRYPRFEQLALSQEPNYRIPSGAPLALTMDAFGNLYVAEAVNRVAIFYNGLSTQMAGNYLDRPLSPGSIAIIYPRGITFGNSSQAFDQLPNPLPLPTALADIQVLVNDKPAPLYFVSPGQINFLVPMDTPESGAVEYQVMQVSTGQILAAGQVAAQAASPALFVQGGAQQGQVAALNEDNTVNGPDNPIQRGRIIQLFGTGQGRVPNAPPDGTPPSGQTSTAQRPRVLINTAFVPDENILYSGLAPSLVGVWQINVRVPADNVPPSGTIDVVVQLGSQFSNGSGAIQRPLRTTIAVKE